MRGEHSIRNILLLCLWTQNTKVSLHRSLNGAVGFVSESLLWSQQLCRSFKCHRRFTWSLHFPPSSTQVTYNMCWWKMSCIEWSAFSFCKGVFMYFQSLFWLWSPWSVAVLPPALLSRNASVGLRCCECWVQDWHHTLHTLLWDLSAQGQTVAGQHSLNRQTREGLGMSA